MRAITIFTTLLVITALLVTFTPIEQGPNQQTSAGSEIIKLVKGETNINFIDLLKPFKFSDSNVPSACKDCLDEFGNVLDDCSCPPEDLEWYDKIWKGMKSTGEWFINLIPVGMGLAGVITGTDTFIFLGVGATLIAYFISIWNFILTASYLSGIPAGIRYMVLSILTFVYSFAIVEWARGKL